MSRRSAVMLTLVAAAAVGGALATSSSAAVDVCQQPAPACSAYDTAKALTAAEISELQADCVATFADSTPCTQLATVGQTAYFWAFYPYSVCATHDGTTYCIGPIE